jgi:hypothetical protein
LVGKPEVKRLLGRPRHRWKNIKMDHTKDRIWTGFIREQSALAENFLTSWETIHFVRTTMFHGVSVLVGQYIDNTTISKR